MGNITKYQLSIYKHKSNQKEETLAEIVEYIYSKIPKSKLILLGGTDDICKGIHEIKCLEEIIHIDAQIDCKDRFKVQLEDKDTDGQLLFKPSY